MGRLNRLMAAFLCFFLVLMSTPSRAEADFDEALASDELSLRPVELSMNNDNDAFKLEVNRYNAQIQQYDEHTVFDQEGILTLAGDQFYDAIDIISMSPDGKRYLLRADEYLMIWNEESDALKIIAPVSGLDEEFAYYVMMNQLSRVEELGVTWSGDGRYIALSYGRAVLLYAQFNYGTLLIDVEKGEVGPLVQLPAQVDQEMMMEEGFMGVPFRTAFDAREDCLYFESYKVPNTIISRYDLGTGEILPLTEFDVTNVTGDPSIWWTEDGLLHTYANNRISEGFGLALWPMDGARKLIQGDVNISGGRRSPLERLISVAGRYGILWEDLLTIDSVEPFFPRSTTLFSLDELSGDLYENMLFIEPGAAPGARLQNITIPAAATEEFVKPLKDQLNAGEVVLPTNGALSPDGKYALFPVTDETALYIYDIEKGVCGQVNLAEEEAGLPHFAWYASPINGYSRGIYWAENNRVLINVGEENKVYELGKF